MKYELAIFDMDGTILDTIDDLADATNHVLEQYGMPLHTVDEVKGFVGNGIHKLIERAVAPGADEETVEKVFDSFNEYYKGHCAIKTKPYDGINETIEKLKAAGVITAVVSNKADYGVQSLCEEYFKGLFDYAVGDKNGQRRKPYPDSVFEVLEKFSIEKKDAVYIGDSEVDYKTAINAGLDSIMVTWGFREEKMLRELGAKTFAHNPEDVGKIILE
ncbi:MAG: HAD-IA family hydrolase [Lachnospiraceae bacterium]|nr:HAD-IA family hydrolase [Lachnospiraceae bacterium]